ncbi:hypothetical protein [Arthrobacter mobilis]|uniref:Uncharacterized protein n=1 Tax=Arthrobacter mobilis TaxID=2724944 RepID=A0A7X6K5I9_9MICC|nr:hypothetical protein [Arthrobacter mobilis]NKX54294.1 hypothetical protein [Arthrobacter mobilis]
MDSRHNLDRQLAIAGVARRARGRPMEEIKQLLREEFRRLGLPEQPGTWLDAVAAEAWYGKPYIIDLEAFRAATGLLGAAGTGPDEVLAERRPARQPGPGIRGGARTGQALLPAVEPSPGKAAAVFLGAIALVSCLAAAGAAAAAVAAIHAVRRRRKGGAR